MSEKQCTQEVSISVKVMSIKNSSVINHHQQLGIKWDSLSDQQQQQQNSACGVKHS